MRRSRLSTRWLTWRSRQFQAEQAARGQASRQRQARGIPQRHPQQGTRRNKRTSVRRRSNPAYLRMARSLPLRLYSSSGEQAGLYEKTRGQGLKKSLGVEGLWYVAQIQRRQRMSSDRAKAYLRQALILRRNALVSRIKAPVQSTQTRGVISDIGGFGGLFS